MWVRREVPAAFPDRTCERLRNLARADVREAIDEVCAVVTRAIGGAKRHDIVSVAQGRDGPEARCPAQRAAAAPDPVLPGPGDGGHLRAIDTSLVRDLIALPVVSVRLPTYTQRSAVRGSLIKLLLFAVAAHEGEPMSADRIAEILACSHHAATRTAAAARRAGWVRAERATRTRKGQAPYLYRLDRERIRGALLRAPPPPVEIAA